MSALEEAVELGDVATVSAIPSVDRLVDVADREDIGGFAVHSLGTADPFPQQIPLQPIEILELVHEEVSVQPALRTGEVLVGAHQACALGEQVVEVQQPAAGLGALEVPEELRSCFPGSRSEPSRGWPVSILSHRQVCGLCPVDLAQCSGDGNRRPGAEYTPKLLGQLAAERRPARQDPPFAAAAVNVVLADLGECDRVKRAYRTHVVDVELPQAGSKLPRGPAGERDRHGASGLHRLGSRSPGNPLRQHPCLAASRSGQHEQRRRGGANCGALRSIETVVGRQGLARPVRRSRIVRRVLHRGEPRPSSRRWRPVATASTRCRRCRAARSIRCRKCES